MENITFDQKRASIILQSVKILLVNIELKSHKMLFF